ncbi:hypothetical protein GNI_232170 [Gregarina niphandrodes]|uniref:Uncharacterized protein n=1 Tax=Gregarina niphandrodes TaxID=110365 RepID=A0A023AVD2_GRENI|nr:hypothetical protein GNI_232170 [Gregarina niphandrodes]EZG42744.1 hypothetical protein GNI_232170 [Gregarina niphandrodes]|eukprot:XP_011133976.1 hypothetical protein GNI_232170 [Gregarina niphandrodes]
MTLVGSNYQLIFSQIATAISTCTDPVAKINLQIQLRNHIYESLKQSGNFDGFTLRLEWVMTKNHLQLTSREVANLYALVAKAGITRGLALFQNGATARIGPSTKSHYDQC